MKIHVCISTYVMRERILNIFARRISLKSKTPHFAINFKFNLFIIMIIWTTKYYFDLSLPRYIRPDEILFINTNLCIK